MGRGPPTQSSLSVQPLLNPASIQNYVILFCPVKLLAHFVYKTKSFYTVLEREKQKRDAVLKLE